MTNAVHPISLGPIAAGLLEHDGDVEVIAVFERCCYISTVRGIACIGIEVLGDGPLNVLMTSGNAAPDWAALGITREAKGGVAHGQLHIGDRFALGLVGLSVWKPPPWIVSTPARLAQSLLELRRSAAPLCPAEGLSGLVLGAGRGGDRASHAAADLVADLRKDFVTSLAADRATPKFLRTATLLLGLGPGLTPSGDDLLGGVFLVLSAMGRTRLRDELWARLEPELDLLTVEISAAHLAATADGLGAAAMHAALNAILAGDVASFPAHLATLATIGHSSGFDTLAGMVLALDALQSNM